MTFVGRCAICNQEASWSIERRGDAVVSWACNDHLVNEVTLLQRSFERTALTVREFWGDDE